jgi:hypothetical protein
MPIEAITTEAFQIKVIEAIKGKPFGKLIPLDKTSDKYNATVFSIKEIIMSNNYFLDFDLMFYIKNDDAIRCYLFVPSTRQINPDGFIKLKPTWLLETL